MHVSYPLAPFRRLCHNATETFWLGLFVPFTIAVLIALLGRSARAANSELDVKTTATDLTASASYVQATTPTTTSDITFTSSTYNALTFTANTNLSVGTVNDLDATQSLIITNNGAANDTFTLSAGGDTVSGSAPTDLIYLTSEAQPHVPKRLKDPRTGSEFKRRLRCRFWLYAIGRHKHYFRRVQSQQNRRRHAQSGRDEYFRRLRQELHLDGRYGERQRCASLGRIGESDRH